MIYNFRGTQHSENNIFSDSLIYALPYYFIRDSYSFKSNSDSFFNLTFCVACKNYDSLLRIANS